jgi:hypothetical protein
MTSHLPKAHLNAETQNGIGAYAVSLMMYSIEEKYYVVAEIVSCSSRHTCHVYSLGSQQDMLVLISGHHSIHLLSMNIETSAHGS